MQPVSLADGPATGRLIAGPTLPPHGGTTVRRADVAEFMVATLTDPEWSRRTVVVTG